jgi:ATP-dependent Clp protease ATP-binding subunit ClpC
VTLEAARERVVGLVGVGEESPVGQMLFAPGAKEALELALREADRLDHRWVGTEHLLLGLAGERDDLGSQVLLDLGVDADAIRDNVVRTLGGEARARDRERELAQRMDAVGSPPPIALPGHGAFEQFTVPARHVVVRAQEEARALGHDHLGAEHLLGLLREERGLASRVLAALGLALEEVRRRVPAGGSGHVEQLRFDASAQKVLEGALSEAEAMHHPFIGTEHMLLGLAGLAPRILEEFGTSGPAVHAATLRALEGDRP